MELEKAAIMAVNLMDKHGLIDKRWKFKFNSQKSGFGICYHGKRIIALSQHLVLLNNEARVKNTILHEIAHALVGYKHGHDAVWRAKAIEIGCDGERCYNSHNTVIPESKYIAECVGCGHVYRRNRLSPKMKHSSCGRCGDEKYYTPAYKLDWKLNPKI